jgi:8-oxo-dGTP diphosphatase
VTAAPLPRIVVTAGVIERDEAFLVTRRPRGVHLAGYWEFPGGKCETEESHAICLRREIQEELGTDVRIGDEILSVTHTYPDRIVELHFLRCELLDQPRPLLGQEMLWIKRTELSTLEFPPADVELIELLRAGVEITEKAQHTERAFHNGGMEHREKN